MSTLAEGITHNSHISVQPLLAAVTVDADKSVFLQMILFAVLIIVMKPLLFDPMLKVFALREEKTDGAKSAAREMQEKAADILSNYESEVAKVRAEATAERDNLRKETAKLEAEILAEARDAAEKIASEGRAKVEAEVGALTGDLQKHSQVVAKDIANQILGKGASA